MSRLRRAALRDSNALCSLHTEETRFIMINGEWSTEEIVEAYNNGVMQKVWPKLYMAFKEIERIAVNSACEKILQIK